MKINRLRHFIKSTGIALSILGIISCQLFENDVADYMETYTETAAIDQHTLSEEPYSDGLGNSCVNSKKDIEVDLFMRNPKKFTMTPSVEFPNLSADIDRSGVTIVQTAFDALKMILPQEFLLASDEGKDISSSITLYEPMSGRYFIGYTIKLNCNSVPPKVLLPTVLNDNGQTFVLAFDMPPTEELALRNKDIQSILINDVEYPLSIGEDGSFTFEDTNFSTTPGENLISINSKDFNHSESSIYFQTNEPFVQGDKSYKIALKDAAGLYQVAYASTSIDRLSRPAIIDVDDYSYAPGANEMVSGSTQEPFKLTLYPPTTDHKGNPVEDATMTYTLYRGTSTVSAIIQEGDSTSPVELNLEPGTYYVEAYATKTNYEQSPISSATFRVVDNAIFVSQNGNDGTADGSRELPFGTLAAAIADVDVRNMPNAHLTIYIDGTVSGCAVIDCTLTRSITITQKTGGSTAVLNGQNSGTTLTVDTTVPVTLKNISVTGGSGTNGGGIHIKNGSVLTLSKDVSVTGNTASGNGGGIYCAGNLYAKENISITNNTAGSGGGMYITGYATLENSVSISGNTADNGGGVYNSGNISVKDYITISGNTSSSGGPSNVYLPTGKTITVAGSLADDGHNSQIGVTTETAPTILTAVTFTTNYGYNSNGFHAGIHPGTYFTGDQYAINKDTSSGEATIFLNSGTFNELLSNLNMSFAIDLSPAVFTAGTATTIHIIPTVTVNGQPQSYDEIASNVTWSVKLTNGGTDVPGVSSTTNEITIPTSVNSPDIYTLLVQTVCYGIYTFDAEFTIIGQ